MSDPVVFAQWAAGRGKAVGVATLNVPRALNALSLPMVDLLQAQLDAWVHDPAIAMVMLQGEGERAFCAGGDLQSLYRSLTAPPDTDEAGPRAGQPVPAFVADFFEREYRLDHTIHHYPKPVLCWGDGVVMGGGMGLMNGASHRVITEHSRLAMPEIAIGLFPDVGGSWFLNRVPEGAGLFLALTAAQLRGADAVFAGFADHHVPAARKGDLVQALKDQAWGPTRLDNDAILTRVLVDLHTAPQPAQGPLQRHLSGIAAACAAPTLEQVVAAIAELGREGDPWLATAAHTLAAGAPGTARLSWALQRRARGLSYADVLRLEFDAVLRCCAQPDIVEGIRALLIDKDKQPRWSPATLADADAAWAACCLAPWPGDRVRHPLADLQD